MNDTNQSSALAQETAPGPAVRSLAARFGRQLRLVEDDSLSEAIEGSIRWALRRRLLDLDPSLLAGVSSDARKLFLQALRRKATRIRGLSQTAFLEAVDKSRQRIRREQGEAEIELERVSRLLAERRQEMDAEQATLAASVAAEGALNDEELKAALHEMFAGHAGLPGIGDLEQAVVDRVIETLGRERERVMSVLKTQHDKETEYYERRIAKLVASLDRLEQELLRVAQMKEGDPGIASIYRVVQGLSPIEQNAEIKKEMMAEIFNANMALKEQLSSERFPKAG